ncbi:MAG TPA: DPP IV N-terminal domain-containing protein [Dehalococcoidia bacterium]|nr:DPP IV N-terminal domain-containing protein [Dehalococcoidia bacterium]
MPANIRHIQPSAAIRPLSPGLPLRLLVLTPNPQGSGITAATLEADRQRLQAAFDPLIRDGKLAVEWLQPPTLRELHRRMRATQFHVLHFIGGAELDAQSREASLVLEDESGVARPISAPSLGLLSQQYPSLRLAVLGWRTGADGDAVGGVASTLVQHGLPAVAQFPGDAAEAFVARFYAELTSSGAVTTAAEAAIATSPEQAPAPTLYLGVRDGLVFKLGPAKPPLLASLGSSLARVFRSGLSGLRSLRVPGNVFLLGGGAAFAVAVLVGGFLVFGADSDDEPSTAGVDPSPTASGGLPPTAVVESERREVILFDSSATLGEREVRQVFSMEPDGSERTLVTSNTNDSVDPSANLTCDQVVFVLTSEDAWDLVLIDLASGDQQVIPGPPGPKSEPVLAPQGDRLVYALRTAGNNQLYIVNVDGSDLKELVSDAFDEQDAAWSPDGQSIAFTSDRDAPGQNHEIYRIPADLSSGPQRLTRQPGFDGEPAWSPDGGRIVFQSVRQESDPNDFSLWIMDATAGDQTAERLTDEPGREYDPAWSPDGTSIAFTYQDGDSFDILKVSASGGTPARLTAGETKDVRPSWCLAPSRAE